MPLRGKMKRGQKKKRALTDRPSELNHFDDTLAEANFPHRPPTAIIGGRAKSLNEKGGWCKPPFLS
jgi:hypothetical protein